MTTDTLINDATLATSDTMGGITFMNTLASEWLKLTTLRSTYVTLGLGTLLSVAMSALISLAVGSTFDGWSPERQAQFAPILMTMTGVVVMLIASSVFGALVTSGEYSSGMMRLTLTTTPNRARVIMAKLALVTGITLVLGFVSSVAMFLAGAAVLSSYGIAVPGLDDPDVQRFVFGLAAVTPLFPVLGMAFGVILRSTAGAVTAVLGLLWLPQVFGELLSEWPKEHVMSRFPQSAADSLTGGHLVDNAIYPEPAVAFVTIAVWVVVLLGAGHVLVQRRDV